MRHFVRLLPLLILLSALLLCSARGSCSSAMGGLLPGGAPPASSPPLPPSTGNADADALFQHMQDAKPQFKAGVTLGQPLKWRVLDQMTAGGGYASGFIQMHVGNFDADPDQEILGGQLEDTVFNADGSRQQLTWPDYKSPDGFSGSPRVFDVWDYDGDGIDDVISTEFDRLNGPLAGKSAAGLKDHMAAFSLTGKRLGNLAGVPMGPYVVHGDFDGDGKTDLFMDEEGNYGPDPKQGVRGFTTGGKVLFSAGPEWTMETVAGDMDGDGRDEIIGALRKNGLQELGVGKAGVPVPGIAGANLGEFAMPHACLDLDGDHRSELLNWDGAVMNLATGKTFMLEPPKGYTAFTASGAGPNSYLVATVNGKRELVALLGKEVVLPETLAIWDTSGKLLYAENMGEFGQQAEVLKAGGVDHLVVMTKTRLLIWP